jgi:hypothetical protein
MFQRQNKITKSTQQQGNGEVEIQAGIAENNDLHVPEEEAENEMQIACRR